MKIGIFVYSESGNTEAVARKVLESIPAVEHQVKMELITVKGELKPGETNIDFENKPDPGKYDYLVFGAPVQAFSLAVVMSSYINQLDTLKDKEIFCFVTKALPFDWTGGNRAVKQMEKICAQKGAKVSGSGIIKWRKKRDEEVGEIVRKVKMLIEKM